MTVTAAPTVPPIFSFPFLLNPLPTLAWLREHDPIHTGPGGLVVLTRYADCAAALAHPGLSAAGGQAERSEVSGAPVSMLNTDGPEHIRLRKPGGSLLGPAAVARALPQIEADIRAHLAGLGSTADLAREISEPLATLALAGILGIPAADQARYAAHAAAVVVALDPVPSPAAAAKGRIAMAAFTEFAGELMDRAEPESPLGRLRTTPELSREDALGIVSLATVGGWAPLADLITVAVHLWLAGEDAPGDEEGLMGWVAEVTRWHTPIPFVARQAQTTIELPSGQVPAGAQVLVHLGAADRDPEVFGHPDAIAPHRESAATEGLAFGAGTHLCLGAPLVRAVVPMVLRALQERAPAARLRSSQLMWQPTVFPRRPMSSVVEMPA